MSASLATIIVERVFDGVVMLGFVFLNLPELANLTSSSGFIGDIRPSRCGAPASSWEFWSVFSTGGHVPHRALAIATWMIDHFVPVKNSRKDPGNYESISGWA